MEFRVLAIGDVTGASGLAFLTSHLRTLRQQYQADFCVVNGENAAVVGITPRQADAIFDAGADIVTLGNHVFNRREIVPYLDDEPNILRPCNLSPQLPGRGMKVCDTRKGMVTVINLVGRCGMDFCPQNPFLLIETLLKQVETPLTFVELHAEATSEKLAMGYLLDGRVTALWGTHTHVPTADLQILPGGTGYVTDLGMTGPIHSVLGIRKEQSIATFRGDLTSRYETAPGPCKLEGILLTADTGTGKTIGAERVMIHD